MPDFTSIIRGGSHLHYVKAAVEHRELCWAAIFGATQHVTVETGSIYIIPL